MKAKLLLCLVVCCSAHALAFNVEPGQKLPTTVTYTCDPSLEADFVQCFGAWNFACNGIFTLVKADKSTPTLVVNTLPTGTIPPSIAGFTILLGDRATITILDTTRLSVMLHEVGHALGMAHDPYGTDSVMYIGALTLWISPDLVNGICSIYGQSPTVRKFPRYKVVRKRLILMPDQPMFLSFDDGSLNFFNGKKKAIHRYLVPGYYNVKSIVNMVYVSVYVEIK